jgi:hypothetical protein
MLKSILVVAAFLVASALIVPTVSQGQGPVPAPSAGV